MRIIPQTLAKFRGKSFTKQAAVLTMGTLGGRLIIVLIMPALTRIYSPAHFSTLASYSAILAIVAVISCMRFEIAIPMPKSDIEAESLLLISLLGSLVVSFITAAPLIFHAEKILTLLPAIKNPLILWLIPLGTLFVGIYQASLYWTSRTRHFKDIALTRVSQAAVGVATMLCLGLLGYGSIGLTLGHMLMTSAGALGLLMKAKKRHSHIFFGVTFDSIKSAAINYRKFPLWSMPEALANVCGLQLSILIVAAFAPDGEAGHLMLAMQVMLLPMSLVGTSISQVYLSRASEEFEQGRIRNFTMIIVRRLALISILPIAIVGLTGPWLFPTIFGNEWLRSGEISALMVPWVYLQFIVVPVSMIFHVVGYNGSAMLVQFCGLGLRLSGLYLGPLIGIGYVEGLIAASSIFYLFMLLAIVSLAKRFAPHGDKGATR